MAAQSWQSYVEMHSPLDARRKDRGAGNAIRGHLVFSISSMLRPPSTSHFPIKKLCMRRFTSGKVVQWRKRNVMSRICDSTRHFIDPREVADGCVRMENRKDAEQRAADATRVSITREAWEGYNQSRGFCYAFFSANPQPGFLLLLRIGCDQHIPNVLGLQRTVKWTFLPISAVTALIQLAFGPMPNLSLEKTSQEDLAHLEASRIAFVCFFLEILLAPTALLVGGLVFVSIAVACAIIGAVVALVPVVVWLIRFLWRINFKRTSVVKFQVGCRPLVFVLPFSFEVVQMEAAALTRLLRAQHMSADF